MFLVSLMCWYDVFSVRLMCFRLSSICLLCLSGDVFDVFMCSMFSVISMTVFVLWFEQKGLSVWCA